jgi:hypothetical protein
MYQTHFIKLILLHKSKTHFITQIEIHIGIENLVEYISQIEIHINIENLVEYIRYSSGGGDGDRLTLMDVVGGDAAAATG